MTKPETATAETGDLAGRIALVTGAARNIGRAIAVALAQGGADVAVHTRAARADAEETARQITALGRRAIVLTGDLADPAQADDAVAQAVEALGGLDIVVNNAALRREGEILTIDYAAWREIMGVTLDAAFLTTRAAMPYIIARARHGGGRIINIGGMTGHSGAHERVHVVTAKAGIVGFTKALALENARKGVTVNCICPGYIDTEMVQAVPENVLASIIAQIPVGRLGRGEEIADMVAFLSGEHAGFVTGSTLSLNGGQYMAG
jgi:3-oxoacyl-[acyl-carrier protein] reductase